MTSQMLISRWGGISTLFLKWTPSTNANSFSCSNAHFGKTLNISIASDSTFTVLSRYDSVVTYQLLTGYVQGDSLYSRLPTTIYSLLLELFSQYIGIMNSSRLPGKCMISALNVFFLIQQLLLSAIRPVLSLYLTQYMSLFESTVLMLHLTRYDKIGIVIRKVSNIEVTFVERRCGIHVDCINS